MGILLIGSSWGMHWWSWNGVMECCGMVDGS